jgi:anti-sigma-K factor RskA
VAERLATPERAVVALQPRSRWPIVATLSALVAVVLLFFAVQPGPVAPPVEPHKMMVASLMMSDKSASVPATVDMTTGEMKIPAADMAPAGKSAQLWMIGGDGVPKPMGLLASTGPSKMVLPADKRAKLSEGVTLAVSVEPVGGSPTGLPTGPVVASGKLLLA